jgi:uncharacterized protein (DUF433 family)
VEVAPNIIVDSNICGGDPHIKGKRFAVWIILEWLEAGKSIDDILASFDILTRDDVISAIYYARKVIEKEEIRSLEISP